MSRANHTYFNSATEKGWPVLKAMRTLDANQVARGKQIYQAQCVRCHGENGVDAPNWKIPDENLNFPSPPHDDARHTWHHPDRVMYEAIRDGLRDPLRPSSELRMPPFGSILSDADIRRNHVFQELEEPRASRVSMDEAACGCSTNTCCAAMKVTMKLVWLEFSEVDSGGADE